MISHFSVPLILTGPGSLGVLAQDSPLEISNSVAMVLATRPGERRCVPDFGLPDPLGRGVDLLEVAEVIEEWEPRADPAELDLDRILVAQQHLVVHPAAFPIEEAE